MKYTFLVNPKSRSGNGGMIWKLIEPELKKRRIDYEVLFTKYERHATELVRELTSDGEEHILVALGGDGTVNEVVNGIQYPEKLTFGIIPTGSGNDFTRAAKLPTEPMKALENILNPGKIVPLDTGIAVTDQKEYHFAVSTGIGFDAAVCHQVASSKLKRVLNKLHLGSLTYLGIALQRLLGDKPVEAELILDDGEPIAFKKMYFAAAMNHPYEGGGFFFCPQAKTDDQILDVIVAANISKLKILFLLPTAFFGKHVGVKGIYIYQCKKAEIHTKEARALHTDGEPVEVGNSLTAKLRAGQIKLMVP
ncbi:MAG: diacylglycerol kinase family lipid kinase [Ruminococcus sp.]|nr:diacylglycerol kinase family lipid kinase [Ruminococcus sp.]